MVQAAHNLVFAVRAGAGAAHALPLAGGSWRGLCGPHRCRLILHAPPAQLPTGD